MNYLEKAWGDSVENPSPADIKTAIIQLGKMDDEHGAFWVGVNDEEMVLETHKDMQIIAILSDEEQMKFQCKTWIEVENLYQLLLENKFDLVKTIIRNS